MSQHSAVPFETKSRIHMGLAVEDLSRSIAFYRTLFDQEPTKVRPHYAKFEVAEPPVNLALNEVGGPTGPTNSVAHFGIQVKSTDAVQAVSGRLSDAGLAVEVEERVACCYALQSKAWVTDPDGHKWEVFVVLNGDYGHHESRPEGCCQESSVPIRAVQNDDLASATSHVDGIEGTSPCSCLTKPAGKL